MLSVSSPCSDLITLSTQRQGYRRLCTLKMVPFNDSTIVSDRHQDRVGSLLGL